MHFLYLDEAGHIESPDSSPSATPVMVIAGVMVAARLAPLLTREFLSLKRHYFPDSFFRGRALDHMLVEVKGSDLLRMSRSASRNQRRQVKLVRLALLDMLSRFGCRVIGRVWVKEHGRRLKADATYCFAVQDIVTHFCHFLRSRSSHGMVVADARGPSLDATVVHSIFTQKWKTGDDPYAPLLEVPVFANSRNHGGLQIADMLVSTLVFPMAAAAYGAPAGNVHASERYQEVRTEHGRALRDLQYRYRDEAGQWRGGLVVSDPVGKRSGSLLFGPDRKQESLMAVTVGSSGDLVGQR